MSVLRGLLLDNLGLKLVALLLAIVVYLHVFTERPAVMVVSFPIELADLPDSVAISSPMPHQVEAELKGSGKQFIRLWLTEPRLKVSLAGAAPGKVRRVLNRDDLPLLESDRFEVTRFVGPDTLYLQLERKVSRRIAVAPRVSGVPHSGYRWSGEVTADPAQVLVRGPRRAIATIDSVRLAAVQIAGKQDSVKVQVAAVGLPDGCVIEPALVTVGVPLVRTP